MQVQIRKLRKKEEGVAIAAGHLSPGLLLIASIFMVVLSWGTVCPLSTVSTPNIVNEMYRLQKAQHHHASLLAIEMAM